MFIEANELCMHSKIYTLKFELILKVAVLIIYNMCYTVIIFNYVTQFYYLLILKNKYTVKSRPQ